MMKNKFFIFINVFGLAVAIACTVVAYFNLEFDPNRIHGERILFVSALLGSGLSYFLVDVLMSNIWKYYQAATTATFVVSVSLMFLLSALAIGYKVFSAASMNTVNTLRDE